jgi:hypothetical protein
MGDGLPFCNMEKTALEEFSKKISCHTHKKDVHPTFSLKNKLFLCMIGKNCVKFLQGEK